MPDATLVERAASEGWTDEDVIRRVLGGETPLYEVIMRRYNQRVFRIARAVLRDDAEAEDVMQDTYVRAYEHLADFEGRAKFSTWLTRIAVHEALARSRQRTRFQPLEASAESEKNAMEFLASPMYGSPDQRVSDREVNDLLEAAILALPEEYRLVFVMREVEELDTADTAESLGLTPENVKVRLHRARALLREELYARAGANSVQAFQLYAPRCDRVVSRVFRALTTLDQSNPKPH